MNRKLELLKGKVIEALKGHPATLTDLLARLFSRPVDRGKKARDRVLEALKALVSEGILVRTTTYRLAAEAAAPHAAAPPAAPTVVSYATRLRKSPVWEALRGMFEAELPTDEIRAWLKDQPAAPEVPPEKLTGALGVIRRRVRAARTKAAADIATPLPPDVAEALRALIHTLVASLRIPGSGVRALGTFFREVRALELAHGRPIPVSRLYDYGMELLVPVAASKKSKAA